MDDKLFESLLARAESDIIDFKEICHQFNGIKDVDDGKFVKDILSFANSIRTETAYIIAGVKPVGATRSLLGTIPMLDDAILQQKVENKIFPKPKFRSYMFAYQGKEYGIIELPIHPYSRPLTATVALKSCKPGVIYFRRSSSNSEADGNEIIEISDWLRGLSVPILPEPEKHAYEEPEDYISRTVSPVDGDPIGMMFRDGKPLIEIIQKHKRIALLGWGLSGKSTELENLAYKLSWVDGIFPFLVTLGNHVSEPIASRIADINQVPQDKMVVLLDGLDEVLPDKFEAARRKISQFVNDYPQATVIVSCRTNFYTTVTDELGESTLVNFDSYRLDNLKIEQVNEYIEKTNPTNAAGFFKEVNKRQVADLLVTPYYLVKLALQFKENKKIADNKAALFDMEVKQLIKKEIAKTQPSGRLVFEKHLLKLFKRLAFIMEAKGTNEITAEELNEVFPDISDYEKVIHAGSIFYLTDSTRESYKFNHNNTQEFLAAQELADQSLKKIKSIIGIAPDFKRVKPSWVNTLSFLNSMLSRKSALKKEITKWLVRHNRDLVIILEPENIAPEVRYAAFKSIFEEYKEKGRRINRTIYRSESLAKFSESTKVFDYLLKQIKRTNDPVIIANALEVINFYPLNQYPAYQIKFKKIYEKYLFGEQDSLHYLALTGYAANFQLTKDEFNAVYLKFKDHEDTWIRFQLFQAIWLSGNQETLISYVIEQAKLLIKEDRRFSHERQNKNRLSNEYSEIARCLEEIKSAPALLKLFAEMGDDFTSFAHSTYFGKALDKIMGNVAKYPKNAALVKQVNNIFIKNHSYILHDLKLNKAFIGFYHTTNQLEKILMLLYDKGLTDFSLSHSIATFATPAFIDFLHSEFKAGRITPDAANTLERYMETTGNSNEPYFRQAFGLPDKITFPLRDYKQEMADTMERNLAALFDKDIYIQEVEKIFSVMGKTTITYNDTYSHSQPDYWSVEFCEVARDALQLGHYNDEAILSQTQERIKLYFDNSFIDRIYTYLLRHNDAVLTEGQVNTLTSWCDTIAAKINFKEAIKQQDPNSWNLEVEDVMFSFFLRKLDLSQYPESLYLDMISFIKYDDQLIEIIPFVEKILGFEKTRDQVLSNLSTGITNTRSLGDHLKFIEENKVTEAVPLLIPYLYGQQDSNHHQVLKIYTSLGGKIKKLKGVLKQSEGYFQHTMIEEFVRARDPYIEKYLKKKFTVETDPVKKLSLSRYLVRLQDEDALDFYVDYMITKEEVPDDSSPLNPLYWLRKPKFTNKVLELYQLAQDKKFYSDNFKDLRSITSNALQNIAKFGDNLPLVKPKIEAWIKKKKRLAKSRKEELPSNLISDLFFYLESFEMEYYNRVVMLNLQQAIALFKSIHKEKR